MRNGIVVVALVAGTLALATQAALAASRQAGLSGPITVKFTEKVTRGITDGSVSGRGQFTMTGVISDKGPVTEYRTLTGGTVVFIRRVAVGKKGTITFFINFQLGQPGQIFWTIQSGTGAYKGLHGQGFEVVNEYLLKPAFFEFTGH